MNSQKTTLKEITLSKPQRQAIPFLEKNIEADVVKTTNLAEASYYMLKRPFLIVDYCLVKKARRKMLEVTIKDLSKKVLQERYKYFFRPDSLLPLIDFFGQYQYLEKMYCDLLSSKQGGRL
jgi:hypothetical protein